MGAPKVGKLSTRFIVIVVSILLLLAWCGSVFLKEYAPEVDLELPKPVWGAGTDEGLNTYAMKSMTSSSTNKHFEASNSITFIVRTYGNFVTENSTTRLLQGLNKQQSSRGATRGSNPYFLAPLAPLAVPLSSIIVSTDFQSIDVLKSEVEKKWSNAEEYENIDTHFHEFSTKTYEDNCCQIQSICNDKHYSVDWEKYANNYYFKYKDVGKKITGACKGNNLLHYLLTDEALKYTLASCHNINAGNCDNKFVVVTNGDNDYDPLFAHSVMERFNEDKSIDAVMTNYMERGAIEVKSALRINQMDLGGMAFRVSSLQVSYSFREVIEGAIISY